MQVKLILSLCFLVSASVSEAQFWKKDKTETTTEVKKDESKKGGSIFQKAMSKVTKLVGNLAGELGGSVAETPSLDNVEVLASVGTNIFPRDLGLATNDFLKGEWVDNGDFTMLMLSSPNGFQFFKYAGTIKLNGKELKHQSFGIHTAVEAPNSGNKKISFEKNGVEEGSFTIPPPAKNIQLLSINGAKSSINIDLTKDVVLELANYTTGPDALIRVDIVTSIIGMRSLTMAAYVKPAPKVVIPAAAFRNIESKNNNWTKTETTKSIDFPQIPEEWLQEVLAGMFAQFTQATAAVSNGQVLPENAIPSAPSYELVQDFFKDEMNTADQFLTVYKNLNPIKPLTSSSMRLFGENALLKETGADALLKVSIALQLSYDGKPAMTPYLTVEMDGVSNGGFRSFVGNTKYFSVTIKGAPYIIKKGKTLTKEEITKIVQVNDLAAAYKKALINLKEKEAAIGDYEIVWKLQQ